MSCGQSEVFYSTSECALALLSVDFSHFIFQKTFGCPSDNQKFFIQPLNVRQHFRVLKFHSFQKHSDVLRTIRCFLVTLRMCVSTSECWFFTFYLSKNIRMSFGQSEVFYSTSECASALPSVEVSDFIFQKTFGCPSDNQKFFIQPLNVRQHFRVLKFQILSFKKHSDVLRTIRSFLFNLWMCVSTSECWSFRFYLSKTFRCPADNRKFS